MELKDQKFESGDDVLVFTDYGRKHKREKIKEADKYSLLFESGERFSMWDIGRNGLKIFNLKNVDGDALVRDVETRLLSSMVYWRKDWTLSAEALAELKKSVFKDENISVEDICRDDFVSKMQSMGAMGTESQMWLSAVERQIK